MGGQGSPGQRLNPLEWRGYPLGLTLSARGQSPMAQVLKLADFLCLKKPVLGIRIRCLFDPLDPGSGMGKKSRNPRWTSWIIFPRAYKQFFWFYILKFFDADADPGIFLTLDPGSGMEKFVSGIRDKHPGSVTLGKTWSGPSPWASKRDVIFHWRFYKSPEETY